MRRQLDACAEEGRRHVQEHSRVLEMEADILQKHVEERTAAWDVQAAELLAMSGRNQTSP